MRGFDTQQTVTVQATLLPDGDDRDPVRPRRSTSAPPSSALSPGRAGDFTPVDLSAPGRSPAGRPPPWASGSPQHAELDLSAVARRFYQTHPDNYDQLVHLDRRRGHGDAFAYETTVANEIQGIGIDMFDAVARHSAAAAAACAAS